MTTKRYSLESSGRPEMEGPERNIQRVLARIDQDVTSSSAFTAPAGVFADPQPTTTQEAIRRIASFVASTHATTIP